MKDVTIYLSREQLSTVQRSDCNTVRTCCSRLIKCWSSYTNLISLVLHSYIQSQQRDLIISYHIQIYQIYQMPPRQLPTVARQGLKFLIKNLL